MSASPSRSVDVGCGSPGEEVASSEDVPTLSAIETSGQAIREEQLAAIRALLGQRSTIAQAFALLVEVGDTELLSHFHDVGVDARHGLRVGHEIATHAERGDHEFAALEFLAASGALASVSRLALGGAHGGPLRAARALERLAIFLADDEALVDLATLPRLREFSTWRSDGLDFVGQIASLEHLSLCTSDLDVDVAQLAGAGGRLPLIRRLELAGNLASLSSLSSFPSLEELILTISEYPSADNGIGRLPNLRSLSLQFEGPGAEADERALERLAPASNVPALTELHLASPGAVHASALASLPNLALLVVDGAWTLVDAPALRGHPKLAIVRLPTHPSIAEFIGELPRFERLELLGAVEEWSRFNALLRPILGLSGSELVETFERVAASAQASSYLDEYVAPFRGRAAEVLVATRDRLVEVLGTFDRDDNTDAVLSTRVDRAVEALLRLRENDPAEADSDTAIGFEWDDEDEDA